jgi:hypothetical protein
MKIIKRVFFRYFDFFVALFSALLINLVPLYSFIRYDVPLYSENGPEAGWVALVSFCGSEYLFYEQKWGLVVPLLCLIYPLKFLIPLYYFALLRIALVFLDLYLVLKVANLIFSSRKVSLIIFFLIFSPAFQLLKFLMGKADINVFPNIMITIARIFNPTFFMIFFLLFLYSFLRFLHTEETSESEGKRKWKLLCAIFLGISLYSQIYWGIYSFSTFIFFALVYFFFLRKEQIKLGRDLVWILLLGFALCLPSLIFNFYQKMILGEEALQRLPVVEVKRDKILLHAAKQPEHIALFLLAIFSFFLRRKFSLKYILIFSGFFVGYFLFLVEYILGIYIQINFHINVPFKLMAKLGIGFLVERIEEECKKYKMKVLKHFTEIVLFFLLLAFVLSSSLALYGYILSIDRGYENRMKNFREVAEWIKYNTPSTSVVTADGRLFYHNIEPFSDFGNAELRLFLYTRRFILYSLLNYFSELRHEDVFNRFTLKAKLIGLSDDEIKENIYDSFSNICRKNKLSPYPLEFDIGFFLATYGKPPDFEISYENFCKTKDDFVNTVLKYYNDDEYFEYLLKKYKVDYVVRKKPYEGEWYLREETKIGDFYIFRVIREKS